MKSTLKYLVSLCGKETYVNGYKCYVENDNLYIVIGEWRKKVSEEIANMEPTSVNPANEYCGNIPNLPFLSATNFTLENIDVNA